MFDFGPGSLFGAHLECSPCVPYHSGPCWEGIVTQGEHSVRRKRVNSIDSVGGRILGFVIFLISVLLAISITLGRFDHQYTTHRSRQPTGRFDPFHLQSPCQRPNRQGWMRRGGGAFELCIHNHYIIRGVGRGDMPTSNVSKIHLCIPYESSYDCLNVKCPSSSSD